ncbi:phage baseplate assembly protein V [Sulfurirhabdus autotrophica]|uniref:Gp5/Type VI secretion system Vgr protein OB-fold domain-containing protein n=1 Tax=Sulfurirhabdus autotrophica TaxID=1706046 RepID=A0A4R3YH91_9PROT|nr:phage baseplate assembly protein V [Sulfurirhabdus autotrophica]TCV90628.1 hypothetical protein EDC63_101602 [Sulfurirhabdus autotrophica]
MRKLNGVYPAVVIENVDPNDLGRIKISIPHIGASAGQHSYETWARLATMMAGLNRGTWFIPDVNDEVLVAFEAGDMARPCVIGSLWNKTNPPPEKMDHDNNKKVIRSRNGLKITLDDLSTQESLVIETPQGQKITLKDEPGAIEIVDSNGNTVVLAANGITLNSSTKVTVNASQVEINSSAFNINAAMSKFSGVVQCDTLISNSVISNSYSPGAGNIW